MSSKKDETQSKILEATWKLLESGDYQSVHMAHIAKKAGVSRQAVYLHFKTRAELLNATTRYIDTVKDVDLRFGPTREATEGIDRLEKFISAWVDYIPEIYGVARALIALRDTDEAARDAWDDRLNSLKSGCDKTIKALKKDGELTETLSVSKATDALWALISIHSWEQLVLGCKWSQKQYKDYLIASAKKILVNIKV
ncbi:MAG: TetR/AcrR family transcriptional regulator [Alphaproteobacteria bacterium]|nr:TetR/AcrR family transcriptional regulator [Alphaproteobacteria bacterium]